MKDNAIIELYWSRDEAAIPATAEKYGRYCNTVAKNILGNLAFNRYKQFHAQKRGGGETALAGITMLLSRTRQQLKIYLNERGYRL